MRELGERNRRTDKTPNRTKPTKRPSVRQRPTEWKCLGTKKSIRFRDGFFLIFLIRVVVCCCCCFSLSSNSIQFVFMSLKTPDKNHYTQFLLKSFFFVCLCVVYVVITFTGHSHMVANTKEFTLECVALWRKNENRNKCVW